jgi:hypothetical protein
MKIRRSATIALAAGTLLAGLALPTAASAQSIVPNVPFAAGVSIGLVKPSIITTSGGYEVLVKEISPAPGNCYFYLYRYTSWYGGWQWLGSYAGTQTTDEMQPYFGYTEYDMLPRDCYGNVGAAAYSPAVTPTVFDISGTWTASDAPNLTAGYGQTVYSSAYYGGAALETTSKGATVMWNTDYDLNQGLVIGTGPRGGIGTVTVGGPGLTTANKGTINFYSATVHGRLLAFKFGTAAGQYTWIRIVATGQGKTGGFDMYFDAAIEDVYNG